MTAPKFLSLIFALLLCCFTPGQLFAQDGGEEKKQEEPTEETIAALKEATAGMTKALTSKSDTDIIYFAKQIVERLKGGDERGQDQAVDTMAKGLKVKSEDTRKVIVEQLGKTNHRAAKHLLAEAKKAKKEIGYLCDCIKAAGAVHDPKSWKEILSYLNHKDNVVISSSIVAVGFYAEEDTKLRQEIVKELLKRYASVASAYDKPNPSTTDKERYNFLFNPFESTLKQLTKKTDLQGANVWSDWFRKEGEDMKEW